MYQIFWQKKKFVGPRKKQVRDDTCIICIWKLDQNIEFVIIKSTKFNVYSDVYIQRIGSYKYIGWTSAYDIIRFSIDILFKYFHTTVILLLSYMRSEKNGFNVYSERWTFYYSIFFSSFRSCFYRKLSWVKTNPFHKYYYLFKTCVQRWTLVLVTTIVFDFSKKSTIVIDN